MEMLVVKSHREVSMKKIEKGFNIKFFLTTQKNPFAQITRIYSTKHINFNAHSTIVTNM